MRHTLLAVGFAVLVSMLLAPHGSIDAWHVSHHYPVSVNGFGPFVSDQGFTKTSSGDWYPGWLGTGVFYGTIGRVMIDMLALEMIFLAVLFAVVANIRWRPQNRNRKSTSTTNLPSAAAPSASLPSPNPSATSSKAQRNRPGYATVIAVITIIALVAMMWIFVNIKKSNTRPTLSIEGEASRSKFSSKADFAQYAIKLREEEMERVQPQLIVPTGGRVAVQRYPWKMNIVATVFWVGEKGNARSVWDANWVANYGGSDNPDEKARRNYIPIAFVPRQNPFYCALPYNDVTHGHFKPEAPLVIPWFKQSYTGPGQSVCRHRWLAIRKGNRVCYAQWEDCGPFRTDHFQYVFGNERPTPNANHGAGLSVSPAVRDYLGLAPTDVTDWQFVEVRDVPSGPWRSYGENNHFVIARRMMEQQRGQSDESLKK
jgi:hypothetical protein